MNVSPENTSAVTIRPPQLIQSLVGGFNAVANHIYLVIAPVLLDLFFWFGPHVRVKALFEPQLKEMLQIMRQTNSVEMRPLLDNVEEIWMLLLHQYNLLTSMSTFPVGIPVLMSGRLPIETPLGAPAILEIPSTGRFLLGWLVLTLFGFLLGTLFFAGLARASARYMLGASGESGCEGAPQEVAPQEVAGAVQIEPAPQEVAGAQKGPASLNAAGIRATGRTVSRRPQFNLSTLAWQFVQVLALVVIGVIILLFVMVPSVVLATLLSLISPFLSQIVLILVSFGTIWFMVPLAFSPHGIFLCGQSVIHAMLNSVRMVRYNLPGTGLFLLMALVLHQVLGLLWNQPPDTSWMTLVGIFGNAVITTGLLASSFIYYRGGLIYMQNMRKPGNRPKVI